MTLLEQLYIPYNLKRVERQGKNGTRHETTAEHTFSTIFLAEYFLKQHPQLNKEKVMQIILYHDFVEIYAGDTFVKNEKDKIKKDKLEASAYKKLLKTLPKEIVLDFEEAWIDYLTQKTPESKFAKAMDALDPLIHETAEKEDWIKYHFTESKLRKYKEPILKEFPILMKFFNEIVEELKKKKIIPKE
jgi:putative hydrolases of HD superfamily